MTWFHPRLMDAGLREQLGSVHAFMGAPEGSSLQAHAAGRDGLLIEGSKHWEYAYAIRQSGIAKAGHGVRALDAGCGRSAFPAYLASRGIRMHGIDLNASAIGSLRPYGVAVTLGSLSALPYRDEAFDHVFCISVLEHTSDPLRCFDELWRVTRLGGILTVTGDYAPWGLPPRTVAAGRVMDHALLRRLAGSSGLVPPESPALLEGLGYFPDMWPTVLPIYLRFLKDRLAPPDHPGAEGEPSQAPPLPSLEPGLRRHMVLQCYRAARHYLHHERLPEARLLFARAWHLDRKLASALAWGLVARLPLPILRALRRVRGFVGTGEAG